MANRLVRRCRGADVMSVPRLLLYSPILTSQKEPYLWPRFHRSIQYVSAPVTCIMTTIDARKGTTLRVTIVARVQQGAPAATIVTDSLKTNAAMPAHGIAAHL